MRHLTSRFSVGLLAAVLGVLLALPAAAAHNGSNKAELAGDGGTGTSVVNYSKGHDTFNASARVLGLDEGTYTFRLRSPDGQTAFDVCELESTGSGSATCSEVHRDFGGFATGEIVDDEGTVVAEGTYARRGNCRDPEQAGSQCEAQAPR